MLVFWKERLVFFAVPKTGSTAFEGALAPRASLVLRDPPIVKHTPVYRYKRFLRPYFEAVEAVELETLAIVRHPESWLGSWYRYRHRDDLVGHPNSTRGLTFDAFVEGYLCGEGKRPAFAQVGSQAKFLTRGADDDRGVDHLFRYEDQQALLDFLEERLRMKITLPRLNVSPEMPLELSPKMRRKLERKAAKEFAVYEAANH